MTNQQSRTVESYLENINYHDYSTYVPSTFALEFMLFIKQVNGSQQEEHASPVLHMMMLDQLITDSANVANLCSRGLAKTTIMGEYLFLYLAVYGELPNFGTINLALYVSDSIENGVKNMRKNLEYRRENSDFLQKMIPEAKFTDVRWEFTNVEGKKFIVKGYGAQTGVRGAKEMGQRPSLAVLDDLVSDEDARSATVIASIEDTVYKAVSFALHPTKQKTIWSGTPFNSRDPLYKAVESGAWVVNVFPVCERFPCTREEFRGGWPERFSYDYVKEKYDVGVKTGKVDTFNQELMLRIMSDEDRLILSQDIQWYRRHGVLGNKENFNFYITTDFATSDTGSSDFSVISVWAYNSNGDWFWVDGICKRQQMKENIDDLFRMVGNYRPESVGIEISGQQKGFISWIQGEMQTRNLYFNLAKDKGSNQLGIRPVTDKLQRFRTMEPLFKMGKMYFPNELRDSPILQEFMQEISQASFTGFKSKHDDCIDTISMLSSMSPWKPSSESVMKKAEGQKDPNDLLWEWDEEEREALEGYAAYAVN